MKKIISIPVKQITDISELSAADGSRQLDFPYFVDSTKGWEYCMVNERTNADELLKLIKAGKVYIFFDINE